MIEDDLDDRYITETYFADKGYKVALEFFEGSADVIEHLSRLNAAELPDVIALDPGKRALETLEALKTHPRFKEIPVVVITEVVPASRIKEAYRLGANSVIQKPSTHKLTEETIGAFAKYWFEVVEL